MSYQLTLIEENPETDSERYVTIKFPNYVETWPELMEGFIQALRGLGFIIERPNIDEIPNLIDT